MVAAGTHPDRRELVPEEGKRTIKIDQIRALNDFLLLKSQYAGFRVATIDPAEGMNPNAANALLKTLEEPPPGAVLLLVSQRPAGLPATIRSRCQRLAVAAPPAETARAWLGARPDAAQAIACLGLAAGAPLQAIKLAEAGAGQRYRDLLAALAELSAERADPVTVAGQWSGHCELLVDLLMHVLARLIRAAVGPSFADDAMSLPPALLGLDSIELQYYLDKLLEARRQLAHPLNEQLVLEQLFIDWCELCRRSAAG